MVGVLPLGVVESDVPFDALLDRVGAEANGRVRVDEGILGQREFDEDPVLVMLLVVLPHGNGHALERDPLDRLGAIRVPVLDQGPARRELVVAFLVPALQEG